MGSDSDFLIKFGNSKDELGATEQVFCENEVESPPVWKIMTPKSGQSNSALRLQAKKGQEANKAQKGRVTEFAIRKRLGKLTRWKGPASKEADIVAKAIDVVMNQLIPFKFGKSFTWRLQVIVSGPNSPKTIELSFDEKEAGRWKA